MGPYALAIGALVYIATAIDYWLHGKAGLGAAFLFYSAANFAFIASILRGE